MSSVMEELRRLAKQHGVSVVERSSGHVQIIGGPLLVNYYPNSKKRSAYVAGTTSKIVGVTPLQAVSMAFNEPKAGTTRKETRRRSYRSFKVRLLKKSAKCHWCGTALTMETATLEHIIPLARGGLDNMNNMTLACAPCNHGRGSKMPELSKQ